MTGATPAQRTYVWGLLQSREVPGELRSEVLQVERRGLTHEDCVKFIPRLKECPRKNSSRGYYRVNDRMDEDWYDEYGHDDSPDMGVHRFDGGLGDGSFL